MKETERIRESAYERAPDVFQFTGDRQNLTAGKSIEISSIWHDIMSRVLADDIKNNPEQKDRRRLDASGQRRDAVEPAVLPRAVPEALRPQAAKLFARDTSDEERLSAVKELVKNGIKNLTAKDASGNPLSIRLETMKAGANEMVHMFTRGAEGKERTALRGILKPDGSFEQQRSRSGQFVDFKGKGFAAISGVDAATIAPSAASDSITPRERLRERAAPLPGDREPRRRDREPGHRDREGGRRHRNDGAPRRENIRERMRRDLPRQEDPERNSTDRNGLERLGRRVTDGARHLAERLADAALAVARRMGTVGKCAAGVQHALARIGMPEFYGTGSGWHMRHALDRSPNFERIPLSEVQRGDIVVQRWRNNPNGHGDIFIVAGRDRNGQIVQANDHVQKFNPAYRRYDQRIAYRLVRS